MSDGNRKDITIEEFEKNGTSEFQVQLFRRLFGKKMNVTAENLRVGAAKCLNFALWAKKFLSEEDYAAFMVAIAEAGSVPNKTRNQAWWAYRDANAQAWGAYHIANYETGRVYDQAIGEAWADLSQAADYNWKDFEQAVTEAEKAYDQTCAEAGRIRNQAIGKNLKDFEKVAEAEKAYVHALTEALIRILNLT